MEYWLPGLAAVLGLIVLGLPIAFAMMLVGVVGVAAILGVDPALSLLGQVGYDTGKSYTLTVVPLFVLMGNLIVHARLADDLYAASNAWLGHRKGGLAMATVAACGGFSSVCGSSLATAATMSKVAMPSMRRYGYSEAVSSGVIAAGGTLGVLIPPSVILVLYGIITQQNIGKLFIAGLVPGLLGVLGYMAAVRLHFWWTGDATEPYPKLAFGERLRALRAVGGVLSLFALVMGGIYLGVFTATEAAGIGASGALVLALWRRALTPASFYRLLLETARTTAMMFAILIGAVVFSNFVNLAGMPDDLAAWVSAADLAPMAVILIILGLYLVLGAVLESLSMLLLTVPIFFPIVQGLGFDPIWFGIVVVVAIEISLITPPIGLNVFVLNTVLPETRLGTIFRGVTPFLLMDIVRLLVLAFIPAITLWLPSMM
ncbi:C4-dicarboxylate TRAP transporter large permease protein DctM [wastewater metagenome]|uniref:C4-dicarboxylate TRAP transporter large permease protein DctM n=2 Tax=unclassified sequences TaxID=12908 RepID=A0A5B8RJ16_9ZZZZ|nr:MULTISPECIES: TRAP transporter large permease [Arhodomonas]MCS4503979.1 TRAP transporter large permease [Arhodomonas aquaeolei]QEA06797.1 C4-dicarboxylate TRAP transporter large permease protein DctM [uncultured organism]